MIFQVEHGLLSKTRNQMIAECLSNCRWDSDYAKEQIFRYNNPESARRFAKLSAMWARAAMALVEKSLDNN